MVSYNKLKTTENISTIYINKENQPATKSYLLLKTYYLFYLKNVQMLVETNVCILAFVNG